MAIYVVHGNTQYRVRKIRGRKFFMDVGAPMSNLFEFLHRGGRYAAWRMKKRAPSRRSV